MTNHDNISEQIPSIHSVKYPCLWLITKQIPDSGQSKTSRRGVAFGHVPHSVSSEVARSGLDPQPRPKCWRRLSFFQNNVQHNSAYAAYGLWACFILWSPRTKSYDCHIMVTQIILRSMDSIFLDWNVLQYHFGGGAMEWNAITKLPRGTAEGSQLQLIGSSGGPQPRRTKSQLVGIPKKCSPGMIILWKSEDIFKHVKISQLRNWWGMGPSQSWHIWKDLKICSVDRAPEHDNESNESMSSSSHEDYQWIPNNLPEGPSFPAEWSGHDIKPSSLSLHISVRR